MLIVVVAGAAMLVGCGSSPKPATRAAPLTATCAAMTGPDHRGSTKYPLVSTDGRVLNVPNADGASSRQPDGTFLLKTHHDVARVNTDGTLSLRHESSTIDLPVVGGGKCGVTTVKDGEEWVTLGPISSDATDSTLLDGADPAGDSLGAIRLLSGQLMAYSFGQARPRRPVVYWSTTGGQYFSSTGDRGYVATAGGVRAVLFPTAGLVGYSDASGVDGVEGLTKISSPPMFFGLALTNTRTADIALLPTGSRDVTMRFDVDGGGPPNSGIETVNIPGTPYLIAVLGSASSGNGNPGMQWTDAGGHVHQWRSNDQATP